MISFYAILAVAAVVAVANLVPAMLGLDDKATDTVKIYVYLAGFAIMTSVAAQYGAFS